MDLNPCKLSFQGRKTPRPESELTGAGTDARQFRPSVPIPAGRGVFRHPRPQRTNLSNRPAPPPARRPPSTPSPQKRLSDRRRLTPIRVHPNSIRINRPRERSSDRRRRAASSRVPPDQPRLQAKQSGRGCSASSAWAELSSCGSSCAEPSPAPKPNLRDRRLAGGDDLLSKLQNFSPDLRSWGRRSLSSAELGADESCLCYVRYLYCVAVCASASTWGPNSDMVGAHAPRWNRTTKLPVLCQAVAQTATWYKGPHPAVERNHAPQRLLESSKEETAPKITRNELKFTEFGYPHRPRARSRTPGG